MKGDTSVFVSNVGTIGVSLPRRCFVNATGSVSKSDKAICVLSFLRLQMRRDNLDFKCKLSLQYSFRFSYQISSSR